MTSQELPSGGGAYERKADGTLKQVEAPTAPQETVPEGSAGAAVEAVEAPVEGAPEAVAERPAKRTTVKET